ncbi:hypothetical protein GGI21_003804, partial [Coemansia aciculifera]
ASDRQDIEELFGGLGAAQQPDVLEQQWTCVVEARRQPSAVLSTWVRIAAVVSDDHVPQLLQLHFGMPGTAGLTRQQ